MFSKFFDSQNLTSHLIFVKSCPTVSSCFYGQNKSKILQNLFHALLNNPINKKTDPPPKKTPKTVKDRGGSRVGMTAIKEQWFFSKVYLII